VKHEAMNDKLTIDLTTTVVFRNGDRNKAKGVNDYLANISVKPFRNPWSIAPLGATLMSMGYFALVWPEVLHHLEGGLMKYAVVAIIVWVQRTGVGESFIATSY